MGDFGGERVRDLEQRRHPGPGRSRRREVLLQLRERRRQQPGDSGRGEVRDLRERERDGVRGERERGNEEVAGRDDLRSVGQD